MAQCYSSTIITGALRDSIWLTYSSAANWKQPSWAALKLNEIHNII